MDISARTLRSLEWDRLTEFLSAEACTDWGREKCLTAQVHKDPVLIAELLEETNEALALIRARSGLSQEGLPDVREALQRLQAGGDLSAPELVQLKLVLTHSRVAKASLALMESKTFPRLSRFVPQLHAVPPLVEAIDTALDGGAQVKDSASRKLASLRKEIHHLGQQIREELTRIIHSSTLSKALQEPLFTQRDGRWVLPVTAAMRHSIPGIVHDSSASGLTVYLEPMPVVELANKMRIRQADAEHEIARILSQLSARAGEHFEEVECSYHCLVELDFIMARARLATRYNGVIPALGTDGRLDLRAARHPLLVLQDPSRASQVVPNDITLNPDQRTLVITGPNTGGKTVFLKTAGLLSLMVRAGLLLPVGSGSKAVVFKEIMADIGDEQSLQQNLSTFSSHMSNIVEIVGRAGPGSLVLLDEIGAGTDPREGAALARAILESLNQSGAVTISTTHLGELKVLAYTQPGFLNASLEFDDATLSPTYKLRSGVPGSSKAITIASRLGLDPLVIQAAGGHLEEDARDLQAVIEKLEVRLKEVSDLEEQLRQSHKAAMQLEVESKARLNSLQSEREAVRHKFAGQIEQEFDAARQMVRELIARLQKEPSSQGAQQAQRQLELIKQQLNWLDPLNTGNPIKDLSVGQKVRVRSLGQNGVVEDLPEPSDRREDSLVAVRCGAMKVKVPLFDLEPVSPAAQGNVVRSPAGSKPHAKSKSPGTRHFPEAESRAPVFVRAEGNTLDLRGQRVDEALSNLERFVDNAVVGGVSPVMVIHGHGTGAIKSAVRQFLRSTNYANDFRPGENYEGGDGVTVINL